MTLTVTVELSPEVEAELREKIAGRDAAAICRLLADAVAPTVQGLLEQASAPLSDDEFEAIADQLAEEVAASVPPDTPPLSDDAVSRAGIYEMRCLRGRHDSSDVGRSVETQWHVT